ncbi:MAG: phosphoribosylamine--glycine ligase [Leptolyngbyaceae cyanobacterium MO_188.B28]|nr:phosphoribosylamine--glycine ligase [Leptolyngbyaceae cyanobacterium MO_188.B28]
MKALVVGSGGREHALAWRLLQSKRITEIICVPGNGGTAALERCRNLPLAVDDFEGIARFALVNNIGLVVVGPEQPLAEGIADYLTERNITVFGPTKAGAQIESSKAWSKDLMREAGIPTAEAEVFSEAESAIKYLQTKGAPIVVKADGLAAGKGVTVAATLSEAISAVEAAFGGQFGAAGQRVVIEEYLSGQEASVLAVTDGLTIRPLAPAQDHKQIGEGDTGANTGGMGAYAPTPVITADLMERIQTEVLQPAIEALQQRGIDYRGILYAGLMITPQGDPKVVEFNCRFGDPEIQAVLPLLETPLEEVMLACAQQRLGTLPPLAWRSGAAACIVLAAQGYPGSYSKGMPITGIDQAESTGAYVFHAGTKKQGEQTVANGGRVLGVTAIGDTFEAAISNAYNAVSCIEFEGAYYRRDIGYRVKGTGSGN